MMQTPAQVWLRDRLVPVSEALVPVSDRGFTSGDGVFEALKVVGGQPFALRRHLQRLHRSAEAIGLDPLPDAELRRIVEQTVAANSGRTGPNARVRITLTAGRGQVGPARPEQGSGCSPTLVVTSDPLPAQPQSVAVITVPWAHNERALLVGAKTTSYAENLAILERARAAGADEALIADTQGRLCEGTTSNVIVAIDGELITPTLATGCLAGVTRGLALEWGIVVEHDIAMAELSRASEVLLSSSTRDLLPARSLDGRPLRSPGPLGTAGRAEFAARAAANPDP